MRSIKTKVIIALIVGLAIFIPNLISAETDCIYGQIRPPMDFFLFENDTGKYVCFQNSYGTYSVGDHVDRYTIYPQVDWYDGHWHYTEEWNNPANYTSKYKIVSDKASDMAGCIRIVNAEGTAFNGGEMPEKIRIRFAAALEFPSASSIVTEISEWSEEFDVKNAEVITLDDSEVVVPVICNVAKQGEKQYSIDVANEKGYYLLYCLPDYRLISYVEAKTSKIGWTNLGSYMVFTPTESFTIDLPKEFPAIEDDDSVSLRCKYGIVYDGETKCSDWSATWDKGITLESTSYKSNGEAKFVPIDKAAQSATNTAVEDAIAESSVDSLDKLPTKIIVGTLVGALVIIVIIGSIRRRKRKIKM